MFAVMEGSIIQHLQSALPEIHFQAVTNTEEEHVRELLSRFVCFETYTPAFLTEVIGVEHDQNCSFLCLLSLNFTFKAHKIPQNEWYITEQEIIGIAVLQKDYGRVLIRPETINDKISELFEKTEIDFDNDLAFSSRYYMLAEKESQCRKCVSAEFRKTVRGFDGLEIEIDGRILIARFRKPYTVEIGIAITRFITAINNGRN